MTIAITTVEPAIITFTAPNTPEALKRLEIVVERDYTPLKRKIKERLAAARLSQYRKGK